MACQVFSTNGRHELVGMVRVLNEMPEFTWRKARSRQLQVFSWSILVFCALRCQVFTVDSYKKLKEQNARFNGGKPGKFYFEFTTSVLVDGKNTFFCRWDDVKDFFAANETTLLKPTVLKQWSNIFKSFDANDAGSGGNTQRKTDFGNILGSILGQDGGPAALKTWLVGTDSVGQVTGEAYGLGKYKTEDTNDSGKSIDQ